MKSYLGKVLGVVAAIGVLFSASGSAAYTNPTLNSSDPGTYYYVPPEQIDVFLVDVQDVEGEPNRDYTFVIIIPYKENEDTVDGSISTLISQYHQDILIKSDPMGDWVEMAEVPGGIYRNERVRMVPTKTGSRYDENHLADMVLSFTIRQPAEAITAVSIKGQRRDVKGEKRFTWLSPVIRLTSCDASKLAEDSVVGRCSDEVKEICTDFGNKSCPTAGSPLAMEVTQPKGSDKLSELAERIKDEPGMAKQPTKEADLEAGAAPAGVVQDESELESEPSGPSGQQGMNFGGGCSLMR